MGWLPTLRDCCGAHPPLAGEVYTNILSLSFGACQAEQLILQGIDYWLLIAPGRLQITSAAPSILG